MANGGWAARATTLAGILTMAATPALAQQSSAEWMRECRREWGDERARHCEVRTSGARARGGTIAAEPGEHGGVTFVGWDRDSIAVEARVQGNARTDEEARALAAAVRVTTTAELIRVEGPEFHRRASWGVHLVVRVPRRSDLRAETENGPITVSGVNGRMRLRTSNGPLSLTAVGGDVRARLENGPLTVRLEGARWEGEGLDAETENGPATLTIPARYSAQLETGTENGPMRIEFPLTLQGRITKRITTTLGDGGPPVRVVTTNGPVVVKAVP